MRSPHSASATNDGRTLMPCAIREMAHGRRQRMQRYCDASCHYRHMDRG